MNVKMILPALTEAKSPFWRPIKYSLFPPLGLATLAGFLPADWEVELVDDHVERLRLDDAPDLVVIQVYITNAYRAYAIADLYRARGCYVVLGGLHVTALPEEAARHADTIFTGPGEQTFPRFLRDWQAGHASKRYISGGERGLEGIPQVRRDLIRRSRYLVPNSIVVTRGCPQHCDFCYKDAFFAGGRSFYTQRVDEALAEIERLPGRHLYFLDDHLLGDRRFAAGLFEGMRGMGRLWQAAATVDSVLRGDLIERAAEAGLRSLFVGFETFSPENLRASNKKQNLARDYSAVARLTPCELEAGYHRAYREFYGWRNIARGAWSHPSAKHRAKHFAYAAGWKKFEPLWDFAIKSRRLDLMTPLLEAVLSRVTGGETEAVPPNTDTSALGAVTSIQGDKSRSVYPIFPNFK